MDFYHAGMRELQDRFEGRAVPDRLAENRMRTKFNEADRQLIESSPFFFLATATPDSVDCSFKGGEPGFVRLVGENMLTWPDYDGNRMYRSLGNITRSSRVGLLFISFDGTLFNGAARLRINGRAEINKSDGPITDAPGAKRWVRVVADHIFTNCPRYIPKMMLQEPSVFWPRQGHTPPAPAWKSMAFVKDICRSGTRRLEPRVKGPIRVCLAFFRPKNSFAKLTVPDVGDVIWRVTAMRQG